MVQQAAEDFRPLYRADWQRRLPVFIKNAVADHVGLMWSLFVVVTAIASADAVELPKAEAEEVIQTFGLKVSMIAFHDGIHKRHSNPCSDNWLQSF